MTKVRIGRSLTIAGLLALAACHAPAPRPDVPPPSLQLLSAAPLDLASTCEANGSFAIDFTVLADGRTGNIQPAAAPPCVQAALTAWVSSFRYAPQPSPVPSSIEWLLVAAKKGS
jgi:hypothetical protein